MLPRAESGYEVDLAFCDQSIPVLTGIGHERDCTLPDEVAHTRFDTPSKVIAGIEQHILSRNARRKGSMGGHPGLGRTGLARHPIGG